MSALRQKRTFVAYQNPAAIAGASRLWEIGDMVKVIEE
jgi:hypothetical protein